MIKIYDFYQKFIKRIFNPIWIVNEYKELGFRILGVNFYYYKWPDPLIYTEQNIKWRQTYKREFNECIHSEYEFKE